MNIDKLWELAKQANVKNYKKYKKSELEKINTQEKKIIKAFTELDEWERKIIELRYFQNKTWISIGMEIPYALNYCKVLRNEALKKMLTFSYFS